MPPDLSSPHNPWSDSPPDLPSHLCWATDEDRDGLLCALSEGGIDDLFNVRAFPVVLGSEAIPPRIAVQRAELHTGIGDGRGGSVVVLVCYAHIARDEKLNVVVSEDAVTGGTRAHGPGSVAGRADRPDKLGFGGRVVVQDGLVDGEGEGGADSSGKNQDAVDLGVDEVVVVFAYGAVGSIDAEVDLFTRRCEIGEVLGQRTVSCPGDECDVAVVLADSGNGEGVVQEFKDRLPRRLVGGRAGRSRDAEVDVGARVHSELVGLYGGYGDGGLDEACAGDSLEGGGSGDGGSLADDEVEDEDGQGLDDVDSRRGGMEEQ